MQDNGRESSPVFDFLEKYIMGPMTKLSQFRMIRSITQAGMTSISFTIVGSMFLILNVLPQAFPDLQGIWAVSFDQITELYMLANHATIGCIAVYFLIGTAFEYSRILSEEDGIDIKPLNGVLIAIMAMFMLAPQVGFVDGVISRITSIVAGEDGAWSSVVYNGWELGGDGPANFGATGIFCAFIIAWFAVRIYATCVDKKIVIKLPEVVPDGVARSFTALVPGFLVAIVCMLIQTVFMMFGTNFYDFIAIPFGFVVNIVGTYPGILLIYFLIHALWLVGIHGATIVTSSLTAIAIANLVVNADGGAAVWAGEYNNAFVIIGGSGCTLGLSILMVTMAKSEQLKAIGKAEIVPAFFNINEPLLFGLPIVYNPALAVPFVLAPMAAATISYFAITLGIIPSVLVQVPWPTPVGIGAMISTGGSLVAAAVAVLDVVVATLIYFPFFKRYDKQLCEEEAAAKAAE
ncbi:PTS cellobiose transporter subunit IIC [Collinsella tanakaei]|nr:PTS cellobiose transporter subunit IIC [Collinsella tanakaei]MBM6776461.1 PTS cellobiose transporter subunit IIC [Collinsella tanakaei]OUO58714.1 PTS cellobiose transporter subunit IIC [Collinsella sp. An271]